MSDSNDTGGDEGPSFPYGSGKNPDGLSAPGIPIPDLAQIQAALTALGLADLIAVDRDDVDDQARYLAGVLHAITGMWQNLAYIETGTDFDAGFIRGHDMEPHSVLGTVACTAVITEAHLQLLARVVEPATTHLSVAGSAANVLAWACAAATTISRVADPGEEPDKVALVKRQTAGMMTAIQDLHTRLHIASDMTKLAQQAAAEQ